MSVNNPNYLDVKVGDTFTSSLRKGWKGDAFFYISTVLSVNDVSNRFGKPDRVVKVKIATSGGKLVDTKLIWVSQLLDGCV
jgi:hypothetical protein